MRILILSTPKTGSTWLRHLLSCAYRIPQLDMDYPFDPETANRMGPTWVSHHHFFPSPALLDWIRENGVRIVTSIRHPGDVLISLYHHLHRQDGRPIDAARLRSMLHDDYDRSALLPAQPGAPFSWELSCSVAWMRTGLAATVRYEDLRADPVATLRGLTARLEPLDDDRIETAVDQCEIGLLRALAGPHAGFFRAGAVGEWRRLLPPDVRRELLTAPPYAALAAELGYPPKPDDPFVDPPAPPIRDHPFRSIRSFDNGVPVVPIVVRAFLSQDQKTRRGWRAVDRTDAGSYYQWLGQPDDLSTVDRRWAVPLTNLAAYVYEQRFDLQSAFDLSSVGRPLFVEWCVDYFEAEFGLANVFVQPLREALRAWGDQPSPEDAANDRDLALTNSLFLVYRKRPDLGRAFPDIVHTHRLSFLHWIVEQGDPGGASPACVAHARRLLQHAVADICGAGNRAVPGRS